MLYPFCSSSLEDYHTVHPTEEYPPETLRNLPPKIYNNIHPDLQAHTQKTAGLYPSLPQQSVVNNFSNMSDTGNLEPILQQPKDNMVSHDNVVSQGNVVSHDNVVSQGNVVSYDKRQSERNDIPISQSPTYINEQQKSSTQKFDPPLSSESRTPSNKHQSPIPSNKHKSSTSPNKHLSPTPNTPLLPTNSPTPSNIHQISLNTQAAAPPVAIKSSTSNTPQVLSARVAAKSPTPSYQIPLVNQPPISSKSPALSHAPTKEQATLNLSVSPSEKNDDYRTNTNDNVISSAENLTLV